MQIKNLLNNPSIKILLGFLSIILIGTLLLSFDIMRSPGFKYSFIDILFTVTSSVCVCGLTTIDVGKYFSIYGQTLILFLIQAGGLGYMSIIVFFLAIAKKKLSLKDKIATQSSVGKFSMDNVKEFVLYIVLITFVIEILGAIFLFFGWYHEFGWRAIYLALFHSVSAFCNAGISLFSDNLISFIDNNLIILVVTFLIILGGIGFVVIDDFIRFFRKKEKLTYHTKIVLFTTFFIILIPTIIFLLTEYNNPLTIGNLNFFDKLTASLFTVVTPRTAGFNVFDLKGCLNFNILICIFLMFIGASPAGTGGGIKTTTFMVLLKSFFYMFFGRKDVSIFKRSIDSKSVERSWVLFVASIVIIFIILLLLTFTEKNFSITDLFFEVVSAFATAGLSLGITAGLSFFGKIFIIIIMFIGRVCILLIVSGLFINSEKTTLKYPEEKILIG
jgi:trk system potassium uptake protein